MIHDLRAWLGCITGFPVWDRLGRTQVCRFCGHARDYHPSVLASLYLLAGRWAALLSAAVVIAVVAGLAFTSTSEARDVARVNAQAFAAVSFNVHDEPADVRPASTYGGLIGWQEVGPRTRREILALPEFETYGPNPNPVSWRRVLWIARDAGSVLLHPGRENAGPPRYATWVLLQRAGTDYTVARVNTHLVAHAWCRHNYPHKAWRQRVWYQSVAKITTLVEDLAEVADVVVVSGDFNREGVVLRGDVANDLPLSVGTFRAAHYDYLMHAPRTALRVTGAFTVPMRSDHDLVVARYFATSHLTRKDSPRG